MIEPINESFEETPNSPSSVIHSIIHRIYIHTKSQSNHTVPYHHNPQIPPNKNLTKCKKGRSPRGIYRVSLDRKRKKDHVAKLIKSRPYVMDMSSMTYSLRFKMSFVNALIMLRRCAVLENFVSCPTQPFSFFLSMVVNFSSQSSQ